MASLALGIGGLVSGIGALGGGIIQGNAAGNAEQTQATEAQNSLNLEQSEFNTEQQNEAPYLQAGDSALGQLSAGIAPGGSLVQPYGETFNPGTFTAPTGLTESNDPGFQARLQLGQQALEETDAAQGITGGGAQEAAEQYGQTFATNDYENVYNNALNAYNTNYQSGLGAFNTNYNVFANNQANQFNRLSTVAGMGASAAGAVNQAGQVATAGEVGVNTNLANQTSNLQTTQGAELAAGLTGAGNAVNNSVTQGTNLATSQQYLNLLAASQLNQSNQSGYGTSPSNPNSPTYTGLN